jgi:large subunit ribosomal protein L23
MSLIKALISERSINEAAKNRYTFVVKKTVNKIQIKSLVEKAFGVKVLSVATVNMPGKSYRSGKKWIMRERPDGKKAIVTVQPGKTIDLFETTKAQE